jgi:hypothetical protein
LHHDDLYVEVGPKPGSSSRQEACDDELFIPRAAAFPSFRERAPRAALGIMTANYEPPPPQLPWSPETRTWVSLLLFAHLFALFVAVSAYTRPSLLQERLHELFEPYLRNLHLTALPVSYPFARYHLTHAGPGDVDFSIEIDVDKPDGSTETVTIPAALQPLVRFRRYQALANAAGTLASDEFGDEAAASILPKAIAASVLKRHEAGGGIVRIRAHGLPEIEDMANLATLAQAARDNVNNVYEARVIVSPTGVELLRQSTTLEAAPVERFPRRRNQPPRNRATKKAAPSQP